MIHIQYFVAMVGNRIVSFGAFLLLAYILSPRDFGIYSLAMTNATVLYALTSNWLLIGGSRSVSTSHDSDPAPGGTVAVSMIAILTLLALAGFLYAVQPFHPLPVRFVVLVLIWTAAFIIYDITGMLQGAREQVGAFAKLAMTRNFAASALCLVGGWLASTEGAIIGQIVGSLGAVALLASARGVWTILTPRAASTTQLAAMLRFGAVGMFSSALYMLTSVALRNPVGLELGEAQAGTVALATDLFFVPVALIINAFGATHAVALARYSLEGKSERRTVALSRFLDQTLLVVVPYIVGGLLLAAPLVAFVLPGDLGDRLATIATPAAVFAAALAALYSLTGALLTFKHHAVLIGLTTLTAAGVFATSLSVARAGLPVVLWISAGIAGAAAVVAYLDLAVRGRAAILNRARARILASAGVMAMVLVIYRLINDVEPVSAVLLGIAVYAACVVRMGVIRLDELLLRKLPEAPALQPERR